MSEENTYKNEQAHGKEDNIENSDPKIDVSGGDEPPAKRHRIRPRWLRVALRVSLGLLIFILLIPVMIYIPPVQSFLKNVACKLASESTGMRIEVDRFALKFPVDVSLQGVLVIDTNGDTLVRAREAVADVKLLPLLHLDAQVKRLTLSDGYYRMVSPDSSMILAITAGMLDVESGSSMNIRNSEILLKKARLKDGFVNLYMNVWKQKPTPQDTTSTPFLIKAGEVSMENFRFAMSMLPTIDTLDFTTRKLELKDGVVDLRSNKISAAFIGADNGKAVYLTPTPEYIASHPAPAADSTAVPSAPMIIMGDSISLSNFSALYAVKGASPLPGFDAGYIEASGINLEMRNFYNEASTVRLPITGMRASERSGLNITSGSGIVAVDSTGISLDNLSVATPYSTIKADAVLSYLMMSMDQNGPMKARIDANIGFRDIESFMPTLKPMLAMLPTSRPVGLKIDAAGSLASLDIPVLDIALPGAFTLSGSGQVDNPMDFKKMNGSVEFSGNLLDPSIVNHQIASTGVAVPPMRIEGEASVRNQAYAANLQMISPAGDVALDGELSLTAESYDVEVEISSLQMKTFMPKGDIGEVTASLSAHGAGFNPTLPSAHTDVKAEITHVDYGGHRYKGIIADIDLADGDFKADITSHDPLLDMDLNASGRLSPDLYDFDVRLRANHVDLKELGFSETVNSGSGIVNAKGWASPGKWLYDITLDVGNLDWNLPDRFIRLSDGLSARFIARRDGVELNADGHLLHLDFSSPVPLDSLVAGFTRSSDELLKQMDAKQFDVSVLQHNLPQFDINLGASGRGVLRQFVDGTGMAFDTLYMDLHNQDKIYGDAGINRLNTGSLLLDTITLKLNERGQLMDYRLHVGNRPGNLDEFSKINLSGYVGGNRASAFLTQRNLEGKTGYRLGLTAAMMDSVLSVHFTPLEATIAYMPWTFNDDNHVDYCFNNNRVDAKLLAESNDSRIKLQTVDAPDPKDNALQVNLDNIRIQDFLKLSVFAPPVEGSINSDMLIIYKGTAIVGRGDLGITDLTYDRKRMGTFDFNFKTGLGFKGNTAAKIGLLIDKKEVLTGHGVIRNDTTVKKPMDFGLTLTEFPLKVLNPLLGADMASLSGFLNGNLSMDGSMSNPLLNGELVCDSVSVFLPIAGSSLKLDSEPIVVKDNILKFNNFGIWGANDNAIVIDGSVDARSFSNVGLDIDVAGRNIQLVGNDRRAKSDIYGKLFVNLDAKVKGPLAHFDVNADLTVLPATDIFYTVSTMASQLTSQSTADVVKFVQFSDTLAVAKADSVSSMMNMRINAKLNIVNGAQATVNLSDNGTNRVQLSPSGNLVYSQNFMGDMRLNGQLNIGKGFARYSIPVVGEKKFDFDASSNVRWNGDLMNPILNIKAVDEMKANVTSGGNSRLINFLVSVSATGTLSSPKVMFDLSTNDDLTVQNELQSMSADQRSNQAMNLLLYNTYTGPGTKASTNLAGNPLYSFLESQLNSWASSHIRGVDLSFGIDQYDRTVDGQSSTTTSYSYQVSKSLFDNRFKIIVGGNYSTDASADENFAQNLISDISFEYMLKQTNNLNMYLKLFRHTGFESILEGEVTETGVGFVMKRRLSNLRTLFRFRHRKRNKEKNDSVTEREIARPVENPDTVIVEK